MGEKQRDELQPKEEGRTKDESIYLATFALGTGFGH